MLCPCRAKMLYLQWSIYGRPTGLWRDLEKTVTPPATPRKQPPHIASRWMKQLIAAAVVVVVLDYV